MRSRRPFLRGNGEESVLRGLTRRFQNIERAGLYADVSVEPPEEKQKKKRLRQQFQPEPVVPTSRRPSGIFNYGVVAFDESDYYVLPWADGQGPEIGEEELWEWVISTEGYTSDDEQKAALASQISYSPDPENPIELDLGFPLFEWNWDWLDDIAVLELDSGSNFGATVIYSVLNSSIDMPVLTVVSGLGEPEIIFSRYRNGKRLTVFWHRETGDLDAEGVSSAITVTFPSAQARVVYIVDSSEFPVVHDPAGFVLRKASWYGIAKTAQVGNIKFSLDGIEESPHWVVGGAYLRGVQEPFARQYWQSVSEGGAHALIPGRSVVVYVENDAGMGTTTPADIVGNGDTELLGEETITATFNTQDPVPLDGSGNPPPDPIGFAEAWSRMKAFLITGPSPVFTPDPGSSWGFVHFIALLPIDAGDVAVEFAGSLDGEVWWSDTGQRNYTLSTAASVSMNASRRDAGWSSGGYVGFGGGSGDDFDVTDVVWGKTLPASTTNPIRGDSGNFVSGVNSFDVEGGALASAFTPFEFYRITNSMAVRARLVGAI